MLPFPPTVHSHWFEAIALLLLAAGGTAIVIWRRNSARKPSIFFPFFWFWLTWAVTLSFPTNSVIVSCPLDMIFIPTAWILGVIPIVHSLWRMRRSGQTSRAVTVGSLLLTWGLYQALVWPQWIGVREAANRSQCKDNIKLLAVTLLKIEENSGALPVPAVDSPPRSWRVELLPYLGESELRKNYRNEVAWEAPENSPLAEARVLAFICPTAEIPKDSRNRWYSAYALPVGPETLFPSQNAGNAAVAMDDRKSTILLVEACGRKIVWTEPRDVDVSSLSFGINLPGNQSGDSEGVLSSFHAGGAQAALADGSVRFFTRDTDAALLQQLLNARDNLPHKGQF